MGDFTKDFNRSEFYCPCASCRGTGETVTVTNQMATILQRIRDAVGMPIKVTVGIRCVDHNQAIGGAPDSRHLPVFADGVDIACDDSEQRHKLMSAAMDCGVRFQEVCPRHLHWDLRPGNKKIILGVDK